MSNILTATVLKTPLNNNAFGQGNGTSADFNNDGYADIVWATDLSSSTQSQRTPVAIYNYNPTTKSFDPFKITIDGVANSWPDVNFGMYVATSDINKDGIADIIVVDENEAPLAGALQGTFTGAHQYAYISNSIGNYNKVDLGFGRVCTHGYGIIDSADGKWRIVENTPWSDYTSTGKATSIATYNQTTGQFDVQQFTRTDPYYSSTPNGNQQQYFYQFSLDVNNDGNTDIIGLSGTSGYNNIYTNNGYGNFTYSKSIDTGITSDITVEEVSVGDFNGDGFKDFVVEGIDRRGDNPSQWKHVRVLINDQHGGFTDQTTQWLGTKFQNADLSYGYIDTMDINKDGKSDLVWNHFSTYTFGESTVNVIDVMISTGEAFDVFTMGSQISAPDWDPTKSSIGGRLIPISDNQVVMSTDWSYGFNSVVTFNYGPVVVDPYASHNKVTGTALANKLTGTASNDYIDGGLNADKMYGLLGDDVYVVDNKNDVVTEKVNAGHDKVIASIDYTLGANVEDLILTGTAIKGTGNNFANSILGNDANNVLDGKLGLDQLTGGAGNDKFVFSTKSSALNVDDILDFSSTDDMINLLHGVFGKKGAVSANDFVSEANVVAHDKTDHFLYDTNTGNLYYDVNGSGIGGVSQIAHLTGVPNIDYTNLYVI